LVELVFNLIVAYSLSVIGELRYVYVLLSKNQSLVISRNGGFATSTDVDTFSPWNKLAYSVGT